MGGGWGGGAAVHLPFGGYPLAAHHMLHYSGVAEKVPYHANDVGNTAKHTSRGCAYNCLLSRHMCFTLPFGDTMETTMQPVRDMLGRIRNVPCSSTWTDISPSTFWGFMEQCVCAGGEALLHFID